MKAKIVLEAISEEKTTNEIAQWKKQVLEGLPSVFSHHIGQEKSEEDRTALLYQQIGQLKVELDWLKKLAQPH